MGSRKHSVLPEPVPVVTTTSSTVDDGLLKDVPLVRIQLARLPIRQGLRKKAMRNESRQGLVAFGGHGASRDWAACENV